jgi:hypothetical protein
MLRNLPRVRVPGSVRPARPPLRLPLVGAASAPLAAASAPAHRARRPAAGNAPANRIPDTAAAHTPATRAPATTRHPTAVRALAAVRLIVHHVPAASHPTAHRGPAVAHPIAHRARVAAPHTAAVAVADPTAHRGQAVALVVATAVAAVIRAAAAAPPGVSPTTFERASFSSHGPGLPATETGPFFCSWRSLLRLPGRDSELLKSWNLR